MDPNERPLSPIMVKYYASPFERIIDLSYTLLPLSEKATQDIFRVNNFKCKLFFFWWRCAVK